MLSTEVESCSNMWRYTLKITRNCNLLLTEQNVLSQIVMALSKCSLSSLIPHILYHRQLGKMTFNYGVSDQEQLFQIKSASGPLQISIPSLIICFFNYMTAKDTKPSNILQSIFFHRFYPAILLEFGSPNTFIAGFSKGI